MIRIAFFGTPEFSVPFLTALVDDPAFEVVAVVSQPDRPQGRNHEIVPTPVKSVALDHQIPVLQPTTLRDESVLATLLALNADYFVVVAYGKIIPQAVLDVPRLGCVNVHPSLLPKYRGPSPMNWAIAEGDAKTGVTIMLLDAGMDTGPILSQTSIGLDSDETMDTLMAKAHEQGVPLLIDTLKRFATGEIVPVAQNDEAATMTKLLDREDGRIDWTLPMEVIERRLRAYQPWPGLWTVWMRNGVETRIKIHSLQPSDFRADLPPGTVSTKNSRLHVDCSDGTIEILELQPEGKPRMSAEAFLLGYSDVNGAMLG
ncbi:MAG: methionyl-tRNA formyltransferase [Candidatus Uhrbacteria bacterium]